MIDLCIMCARMNDYLFYGCRRSVDGMICLHIPFHKSIQTLKMNETKNKKREEEDEK